MPTKSENLQRLADCGVVAVIRASSPEQLPPIAEALLAGGLIGLEVTMTTPHAIQGIEKLADLFGDRAVIGVGTVLDAATARDAISAGSQFVVSPMFDRTIVETTLRYGKLSMPGSYTPTEIMTAFTAGADVVKVFPSAGLGPQYFKDILAPLPQLRLMPTGGTDPSNAGAWIKAGAVCLGAGSSLLPKDAIAKSDWATITRNAKAFVDAVAAARKA